MTRTFLDLHLNAEETGHDLQALMLKYESNTAYVKYLSADIHPIFLQHGQIPCDKRIGNCRFIVKKGRLHFLYFISLFFYVKSLKPDVLLLHGFVKPWRILCLQLILGKGVKVLIQNHGDKPLSGLKLLLQRMSAKYTTGFIFVSQKQSEPWVNKAVIGPSHKVFSLMEGSTSFVYADKVVAKKNLGLGSNTEFLWVGRLDHNKDPLTIIKAFANAVQKHPTYHLTMIYGTKELEKDLEELIAQLSLNKNVTLKGALPKKQIEQYLQAADYFILGSHREGSGYALCEAMSCGAVPIVTNIPSFMQMTDNGSCAYLFEPGDLTVLTNTLCNLSIEKWKQLSLACRQKFKDHLSFEAIGKGMSAIVNSL